MVVADVAPHAAAASQTQASFAKWSGVLQREFAKRKGPELLAESARRASRHTWTMDMEAGLAAVFQQGKLPQYTIKTLLQWCKAGKLTCDVARMRMYMSNAIVLQQLYGHQQAVRWIQRYPHIIRTEPAEVQKSFLCLNSLLQLRNEEAQDLCTRLPVLLTIPSSTMLANFSTLRQVFQKSDAELRDVVLSAPLLIASKPDTVAAKLGALQHYASRRQEWADTLQNCAPKSLGMILTYSRCRYIRLEYMLQREAQPINYYSALMLSDQRFLDKFPGYAAWRAVHKDSWQLPELTQQAQSPAKASAATGDTVAEAVGAARLR